MKIHQFQYQEYDSLQSLSKEDFKLFQVAQAVLKNAYAPYSKFQVAAAILLDNEKIITGTNQENAAYPSGICAERTAIFYASSQYPDAIIKRIAITAHSLENTLTEAVPPCGACRQSLYEYEFKQKESIEVLFGTKHSKIYKIIGIHHLLPFSFNAEMM